MSIVEKDYISRLREKALQGIMWRIAHTNIGIYPQAITDGPHAYEKRSEWQEGWNACAKAATKKLFSMHCARPEGAVRNNRTTCKGLLWI